MESSGQSFDYAENLKTEDKQLQALQKSNQELEDRLKRAEAIIDTRLHYEQMLSACSQVLLTSVEREEAITETLYELLAATGTSRVYLCKNFQDSESGNLYLRQVHEMCALNIPSLRQKPAMQRFFYRDGLKRWQEALSSGRPIAGNLKGFNQKEQQFLNARQTASVLILPLWVQGKWYGFIGFDDVSQPRSWQVDDVKLLQTAVDMIGSYFGRHRAEHALRESEEKYRTLIEQSSDAIFLIYGGRFELVNRRFTDMFGVTPEDTRNPDFVFTNISDVEISPIDGPGPIGVPSNIHRPPYEFEAVDKDGNKINVELTVSYPSYKQGMATQGILRDITERKRHEEERRQAYEQVHKYASELAVMVREEQRQRTIATILAEVVASVSLTLSTDELLTHILTQLQHLVPYEDAAVYLTSGGDLALEAARGRHFETEKLPIPHLLFKDVQRRKSYMLISDTQQDDRARRVFGDSQAGSWIGAPLVVAQQTVGYLSVYREQPNHYTDADGELVQAFAHQVAQTIHNARLFAEVKEMQAQLVQQERLAALGQMAATIAHELRNPLMSLRMGVEYLTLGVEEDDPRYRGAMLVQSNIDRIVRVTENILYVARTPHMSPSWGMLTDLINHEVARWDYKFSQRSISYQLDLSPDLAPVFIDFEQIGRAMSNLISNSLDAMSAGGMLKISLAADGDSQIISVADNGTGISVEDQRKIFEPFYTTKSRGTGLGLAIVKQIVEAHRGTVDLWSRPGQGTKIIILLPQNNDLPAD